MAKRCEGKLALVTGGAQGLGNKEELLEDLIERRDVRVVFIWGYDAQIRHAFAIGIRRGWFDRSAGVDAVLLDNMDPETLKEAVKIVAGRAITEASGGINLSTARAIAETGVDMISIGALTHSAPNFDIAMDFSG